MEKRLQVSDYVEGRIALREPEVLLSGAQGLPNRQTAKKLSISVKTVERHRENVRDRFGLHGTQALSGWAIRMQPQFENGWMHPVTNSKLSSLFVTSV